MLATAKELRFRVKELLERVTQGEEIVITYHGRPKAKLIPFIEEEVEEETDLFGIWQDNEKTEDVDAYIRQLRRGRFHVD